MLTMTPIERFRNDNRFHAIVNNMVAMLDDGQCDYATLQQAAITASIRHAQIHGAPVLPMTQEFLNGTLSTAQGDN